MALEFSALNTKPRMTLSGTKWHSVLQLSGTECHSTSQRCHLGLGAVAPPPPKEKEKRKKKRKKKEKRKKEKKERRQLNSVKLLLIKCCFFRFFNSPVALKNKKKFAPPRKSLNGAPALSATEWHGINRLSP